LAADVSTAHDRCVGDDAPGIDRPNRMPEPRASSEIRAAIDLGTNSFHLLVARVDRDGHFDVLGREKEVVRLGSGAGELKRITPDAIERGLAALGRFRLIADSFGATIAAVGTSALREARNRDEFLTRARDEVGVHVDVVSGVEEARLIHLGVLQTLPVFDELVVVVDIGGGSTEFVVGEGTDVHLARSLKLGAIRLTDRFCSDGVVDPGVVDACRSYVRSFLVPVLADVAAVTADRPFRVVASSGTALTLARIVAASRGDDPASVASGDTVSAAELRHAVARIVGARKPDDRADIEGLDERRRDIIPAGAVLLEEIVDLLGVDGFVVSDAALREGLLVDRVASRPTPPVLHRLGDIRRRSVVRMANAFHQDLGHIAQATDLALELFDGLEPAHGLSAADRDLLEAAGLLHNVGLFISHAAHHRHSYYVIRNTDQLVGFTDREIELIAQIARYHRKSEPKPRHVEFQALGRADRDRVRILAGILRIAIALDRTRRGAVEVVTVHHPERGGVDIEVHHPPDADMALERYTAEQRLGLLGRALGAEIRLHFVADG
jgi:exopolyphosphatase/guanosine-5'-triphosphate,3'-diphosphate pyrophosphatase